LGGGYLMVLGVQSIWRAARRRGLEEAIVPGKTRDEGGGAQPRVPRLRSFLEGFLTNLLNPKVALFYLAVLPQFIAASDPVLLKSFLLAGIHWMMGIVWLGLVAVFLGRVDAIFNHPALRRVLEATSGTLLVALGLRLALERR
jgi:threonine/homoserine/homoserine lactone efflux protein